MKIDQLQYFIETAKHQHIGKAAKILHISPSAISHSISGLESELGRPLFEKKGKNIFLTSYGKILLERGEKILLNIEKLKYDLSSDDIEHFGHYRLSASHMLCENIVTPVWCQFKKKYPKLSAEIFTLRSGQVYQEVLEGKSDIGVCFSPQSHPDLIKRTLHKGNMYIYVRKNHPILKLSRKECGEKLSEYSSSLPKAFSGIDVCVMNPVFKKNKIKPNPEMMFDSYPVSISYVQNTDSWGFYPEWVAQQFGKKLVKLDISENWNAPYTIEVIWNKNKVFPKVVKQFLDAIEHSF